MAALAGLILTNVSPFVSDHFPAYVTSGRRGSGKSFQTNGALVHTFAKEDSHPALCLGRCFCVLTILISFLWCVIKLLNKLLSSLKGTVQYCNHLFLHDLIGWFNKIAKCG